MLTNESLAHKGVSNSRRKAILLDLGTFTDYKQVWDYQKRLVEQRRVSTIPDSLILNEHTHVFTIGRNGHIENMLEVGLPVISVERGGDVTYHGPGQLVAYPVLCLEDYSMGVRQYVQLLERVIVKVLEDFGIKSEGRLGEETGVWTNSGKKIASVGIAVSHWVTYHGFALNVSTDLSYFDKIKPCGFDSSIMTSMERELGRNVMMNAVKDALVKGFSEIFCVDFQRSS